MRRIILVLLLLILMILALLQDSKPGQTPPQGAAAVKTVVTGAAGQANTYEKITKPAVAIYMPHSRGF